MIYKTTKKLFYGKYRYKIVIKCAGAGWFRGSNWNYVLNQLHNVKLHGSSYRGWRSLENTDQEIEFMFELLDKLQSANDTTVRVEHPWISVYANDPAHVDLFSNIDPTRVRYVSIPPVGAPLEEGTIFLPDMDFEYRITLGKTRTENSAFVNWALGINKIQLTKTCIRDLSNEFGFGGSYFYLSGNNNLLMAKMHLGPSIVKIERIIKAEQ